MDQKEIKRRTLGFHNNFRNNCIIRLYFFLIIKINAVCTSVLGVQFRICESLRELRFLINRVALHT